MGDDFKAKEKRIEGLKLDNEVSDQEVKLAEKKKLISEAKKVYGRDWKKIIGSALKGIHPNQEALSTMYSSGVGLKDYNDMGKMKRLK